MCSHTFSIHVLSIFNGKISQLPQELLVGGGSRVAMMCVDARAHRR